MERTLVEPRTVLYKEFLAERQEILRHKWIESEKAGYDIGFEYALFRLDPEIPVGLALKASPADGRT